MITEAVIWQRVWDVLLNSGRICVERVAGVGSHDPALNRKPGDPRHRRRYRRTLRELTLDTSKRYQGTGRPPGPTR